MIFKETEPETEIESETRIDVELFIEKFRIWKRILTQEDLFRGGDQLVLIAMLYN